MKLRAVIAVVVVLILFVAVKALSRASGMGGHAFEHRVAAHGAIKMSVPDAPIATLPDSFDVRLSIEREQLVAIYGLYLVAWPVPSAPDGELVAQFIPVSPGAYSAKIPPGPLRSRVNYQVMVQAIDGTTASYPVKALSVEFRGPVAAWAIVAHIVFMFVAVAFFTVAAMYARDVIRSGRPVSEPGRLSLWGTAFLVLGGIVLGIIVEYQRLGMLWGGIPIGTDITDSKTLVNIVLWIIALVMLRGSAFRKDPSRDCLSAKAGAWLVIALFVVTLLVFLVPHSLVVGS